MMYLMRAGGFPMWIVLLFGIIVLAAAILFAWRPDEGKLGFIRGMSMATVFAILSGVSADLAATFYKVTRVPEFRAELVESVLSGLSESMSPAILGFSILSIVWLVTAMGVRRLAAS